MARTLGYIKLSTKAITPTRGSVRAAGYDLYSAGEYCIKPTGRAWVNTDLRVIIPPGCYGRVAARSGLAGNCSVDVGAGVIDPDFEGSIRILLINGGTKEFLVTPGDRIAQLILEKIYFYELKEYEVGIEGDQEGKDGRQKQGFGSTGK